MDFCLILEVIAIGGCSLVILFNFGQSVLSALRAHVCEVGGIMQLQLCHDTYCRYSCWHCCLCYYGCRWRNLLLFSLSTIIRLWAVFFQYVIWQKPCLFRCSVIVTLCAHLLVYWSTDIKIKMRQEIHLVENCFVLSS